VIGVQLCQHAGQTGVLVVDGDDQVTGILGERESAAR
jgi:hypothetical protein